MMEGFLTLYLTKEDKEALTKESILDYINRDDTCSFTEELYACLNRLEGDLLYPVLMSGSVIDLSEYLSFDVKHIVWDGISSALAECPEGAERRYQIPYAFDEKRLIADRLKEEEEYEWE